MTMQKGKAVFAHYSAQVLAWQLGQPDAREPELCGEDAALAQRTAQRVLRTAARGGHQQILLLGVGDGTLASLLLEALGKGCELLVLEDSPQRARQALLRCPQLSDLLLVDTSPWALLLLTLAGGLERKACSLVYNPQYPKVTEQGAISVLEQWRRLFLGAELVTDATRDAVGGTTGATIEGTLGDEGGDVSVPSLSVACIAHPEETLLAEFLAQVPSWVAEVVILWDGAAPAQVPECAVPLRQLVRPLAGNFAEQRNAMLEACSSAWCLYLDVDEALSAPTWAALPQWMKLRLQGEPLGAIALTRETFMGDSEHVRMGYGLWPDVQVRLFPLHKGLRFVGAVHEQLTGVEGAYCLAAGHALLHYSHVRKDRDSLAARLQVFDAAGQARHVLSAAYPALPAAYFSALRQTFGSDALLRLPLGK